MRGPPELIARYGMDIVGIELALLLFGAPLLCLAFLFCMCLLFAYWRLSSVLSSAEHALRESEVLKKATCLIPLFIVTVDKNKRIAFANDLAGMWAAQSSRELVGVPVATIIPSLRVAVGISEVQAVMSSIQFRDRISFADGSMRECSVHIVGASCLSGSGPVASIVISDGRGDAT